MTKIKQQKLMSENFFNTKNMKERNQALNLDPKFSPFGEGLNFKKFDFPSGCEPHIRIEEKVVFPSILITTRINSMNDLMILMLAVDALRRMGTKNIELFLPYLPFARQDRVMVPGEPLSIKVIADMINSCNFDLVEIYDPHSYVSAALINNFRSISNHTFVRDVLRDKENYLIVSPDAGAYKKIFDVCQFIGHHDEIVFCNKIRDVKSGIITKTTCSESDFCGKDLYIIDDLIDGGKTFIMLSEELRKRNCGKVNLIVSHGIFSAGIDALHNIDHVYVTNSFKDLESHPKVSQTRLENLFF